MRELIERIFARNPDDFYEQSYEGWYCVGCEAFKQRRRDRGRQVRAAPDARRWSGWRSGTGSSGCPATGTSCCELHRGATRTSSQPESRRNEILGLLDQGLEDISASRSPLRLGRSLPPAHQRRRDAEARTSGSTRCRTTGPRPASRRPGATLAGAAARHRQGHHPVPLRDLAGDAAGRRSCRCRSGSGRTASCYFGGERFSKSAGVKLDLGEAIDRYGPDAFRYFLLREIPFDSDGNFTWERFEERYTSDLADGLGNLASRSLAMIERTARAWCRAGCRTRRSTRRAPKLAAAYAAAMDALDLRGGAELMGQLVTAANLYIVQTAPWTLAKNGERRQLDAALGALARCLARLAVLSGPFMPGKSRGTLGTAGCARRPRNRWRGKQPRALRSTGGW